MRTPAAAKSARKATTWKTETARNASEVAWSAMGQASVQNVTLRSTQWSTLLMDSANAIDSKVGTTRTVEA